MNKEQAKKTVEDNFWARPGTFMYFLHERKTFSVEKFNQLYMGFKTLSEDNSFRTLIDFLPKLNDIYQNILKTITYHFDSTDPTHIKDLPEDYGKFLEQMYGVVGKYNCRLNSYAK